MPRAKYAWHFVTLIALLAMSWLLMMAVHELGHILAAWVTGGTVQRVVLHPLAFSRTDVSPNPSPLWAAWSGPVMGVGLPLVMWLLAWVAVRAIAWLFQCFVVFCLLVNGMYIGVGWTQRVGDAGDMLRLGSERWQLVLFGAVCLIAAIACGRGLEQHIRPRLAASHATPKLAISLVALVLLTATTMALLSATA